MPVRPVLLRTAAAAALFALAGPAVAAPVETHLEFTVLRDGDPVGHDRIDLARDGDSTTVTIDTNVVVKVAFVPVYRFEHKAREVWANGRLTSLRSQTNDDGDHHTLVAVADGDGLDVNGDGARSHATAGIIPASLWDYRLVRQSLLLNTLTGKQMAVQVADLGEEPVHARGALIKARHYRVSGDLKRDVWYDSSGTLVQVEFKAKDDSDIRYVLG